jgi:hypothetical protein
VGGDSARAKQKDSGLMSCQFKHSKLSNLYFFNWCVNTNLPGRQMCGDLLGNRLQAVGGHDDIANRKLVV